MPSEAVRLGAFNTARLPLAYLGATDSKDSAWSSHQNRLFATLRHIARHDMVTAAANVHTAQLSWMRQLWKVKSYR